MALFYQRRLRRISLVKFTLIIISILIICNYFILDSSTSTNDKKNPVNVAITSCGNLRTNETLTLIKSTLLFASEDTFINFFIFTEAENNYLFERTFLKWPFEYRSKFNHTFYEPKFPSKNQNQMRNMYKLCSTQRLFLPHLLESVDAVIYIDMDSVVLADVKKLWDLFENFDQFQLAAFAYEIEDEKLSYYHKKLTYPYYGTYGINAGIGLFNLTRMREFEFSDKIIDVYERYKDHDLHFGDQCLINILFHSYPERVFVLDCTWNFRREQCSKCDSLAQNGIKILHGSSGLFTKKDEPAFRAIYVYLNKLNLGDIQDQISMLDRLQAYFSGPKLVNGKCSHVKEEFLKPLKKKFSYF